MKHQWCISTDWRGPADGEEWHVAADYDAAFAALQDRIAERRIPHNPYNRFVIKDGKTVVDFGSHTLFGVIKEAV